ncbi:nucleoside monophosphate kinase [Candidatus Parcubacteria bacterium]|nr:MAG: nucleoside monophosphate kinase [Candidatus Parcubacteria bacterium]
MKKKLFNLILLGDPASGKATQGRRLVRRYGLYELDMGREVRRASVMKRYDYGRTVARGKLAPTRLVRSILRRAIAIAPQNKGILFNGAPKMVGEAKLVSKWLSEHGRLDPIVVYVGIPIRETMRRIRWRREYVGGKLRKRDDDDVLALQNRAKYYQTEIKKTVAFFRERYKFKKVSGLGTRSEVYKRIISYLDKQP